MILGLPVTMEKCKYTYLIRLDADVRILLISEPNRLSYGKYCALKTKLNFFSLLTRGNKGEDLFFD